ncbi:MAG: FUSC family protein, partial [Jatrophihabitans sp.]
AVLRANFDLRSPALRHSTRLAILVPLTDVITREAGISRGYWISLTILVVLRPDFGATFQRSLMRVLGTLVGLLLASVLVHFLLGDTTAALIVLLGLFFFGMRLAGPTNMGLSSVCLSGLVVILLALAGIPAHTTVIDRSVDTAAGGLIALLAALLWPSWERRQVPERLAGLLGAYREYLRAMVDPDSTAARRSATRSQARLARSAAEASVDRARAEPVDSLGYVELGGAVLAHSHRLVHALTALDATRQAREVYQKVPEFRRLIEAVSHGLGIVQQSVEHGWVQVRELGLRPLQVELVTALDGSELSPELAAALVEATDRLVNSLDSVAAVLRKSGAAR